MCAQAIFSQFLNLKARCNYCLKLESFHLIYSQKLNEHQSGNAGGGRGVNKFINNII